MGRHTGHTPNGPAWGILCDRRPARARARMAPLKTRQKSAHARARGSGKKGQEIGAPSRGRWAGPGTLAAVRPLFNSGAPGLFYACLSGDGHAMHPGAICNLFVTRPASHARARATFPKCDKSRRAWACPQKYQHAPTRRTLENVNFCKHAGPGVAFCDSPTRARGCVQKPPEITRAEKQTGGKRVAESRR